MSPRVARTSTLPLSARSRIASDTPARSPVLKTPAPVARLAARPITTPPAVIPFTPRPSVVRSSVLPLAARSSIRADPLARADGVIQAPARIISLVARERVADAPPTGPDPARVARTAPVPLAARSSVAADPREEPPVTLQIPATYVGIIGVGGTHIAMTPAPLISASARTDITDFSVTLDAGTYI